MIIFCYLRILRGGAQIYRNLNKMITKTIKINAVIHFGDIGSRLETFEFFHFFIIFDPMMRSNWLSCQHQVKVLRASEKKGMFFDENNETRVSQFW